MKSNKYLVEYAIAQIGRPYWMGTFGEIATQNLLDYERGRFPKHYTAKDFESQLGQKVHDCGGLVKGALWSKTPDSEPKYKSSEDYDAGMFWKNARVKGSKRTMPEVEGLLVYNADKTHVGIYVGKGDVVEAKGHAYGVVRSKVSESRWADWSDCCFIDYGELPVPKDNAVRYEDITMVRKGSTGTAVRVVQAVCLVAVDGIFGANTDKAVRAFQKRKGLEIDGIVGPNTWKAIIEEL